MSVRRWSARLAAGALLVAGTAAGAVPAGASPGSVPGTGPTVRAAAAEDPAGLEVIVAERGRIAGSVDAAGTLDGTTSVTVTKPAGGTLRRAVLLVATTGGYGELQGEIGLAGAPVDMGAGIASSIQSYNYWADVTARLKPALDLAPAGDTEIPVTEQNPGNVDGVILAAVFDDPGQTRERSVTFLFGATQTTGDQFELKLSKPFDPASPGALLEMSLGISYSYQESGVQQYSRIDVNGQRVTTSAGGEDDGEPQDGGLITAGGVGDSAANPADPQAGPTNPRSDDELYDLRSYVPAGSTTVGVDTLNPSDDDNILFASFVSDPPVTQVITPNPPGDQDLVALGDGYSSGEGTGNYDAGPAGTACHRGPDAWPRDLDDRSDEVVSLSHRACTGSTVADLGRTYRGTGPQIPSTPDPEVELVTLTVGAGDVGLASLLADCANPAPTATCADDVDSATFRTKLARLGKTLDTLYPRLRAAYPNARIVHVGYPRLTPPTDTPAFGCGWLSTAEQAAAGQMIALLNGTIEAAVDRRGSVEYVDASAALAGHELCTAAPWVAPVSFSLATEGGYPTAAGQSALAELVAGALGYPIQP